MSKKRNTRNTNKSLKALKRKQYARGGKNAVKSQRELLEEQQKKTLANVQPRVQLSKDTSTPIKAGTPATKGGTLLNPKDTKLSEPKVNPSLYSDPNLGGGRGRATTQTKGVGAIQQQTGPATTVISDPVKPSMPTAPPPMPRDSDLSSEQRRQAEASRQEVIDNLRRLGRDTSNAENSPLTDFVRNVGAQSQSPRDSDGSQAARLGRRGFTPPPRATEPTVPPAGSTPPPPTDSTGGSTPDPESPTDVPLGMDNKNFGARAEVVDTGVATDAPVGIRQTAPTAELQQMNATLTAGGSLTADAQRMLESFMREGGELGRNAELTLQKAGLSTDVQKLGEAPKATAGTVTAKEMTAEQGDVSQAKVGPETRDAERYEASTAQRLADIEAAQGRVTKEGVAAPATAEEVRTAKRRRDDEAEALGDAVGRPDYKDYAKGAMDDSDYGFDPSTVDEPKVTTSEGMTIPQSKVDEIKLDAEKRGLDPTEALDTYSKAMVQREIQTGKAAEGTAAKLGTAPARTAAQADFLGAADVAAGRKEQIADAGEAGFATREGRTAEDVGAVPAAQTGIVDGIGVADRNFATGEVLTEAEKVETNLDAMPAYEKIAKREAAVGEAATRIANELGDAPSVDLEGREAILGEKPQGNAAQIGGIPTMAAATMQAVTGQDRTVAAADMMEVVANIPENITAAITQDPASVEAQLDSGADPSVTAAVAALPQEALVSTQMEGLLAGMEDGETPAWARPAVAAIEAQMARRGLSTSTVGRDALFNAIIQSALPMAQSNAQALQQRAQQNLSNEQQANLASAQNTMQVRMQNLANRQTAASQTADMAQQIAVQQGTFDQQAVMTSAQQQQESRMATTQMAQQRAQQVSAQNQQAAIAQLSTNAQMDLANLQALNAAEGQNLNAEQQARLQTYNAQVSRTMRKADLQQDMEKANLSTNLQVELANLAEKNTASRESMSVKNQERLTKLNTLVDFKKTNATLAQQMDMANMSNEQQINMAELAERAATDAANFTEDNRFELQRLQTYAQFMSQNTELAQQTELANFTASEKINLANLMAENQASSENLSKDQQVELANLNAKLKTETLNAQLRQQAITQTFTQAQQTELANLESLNRADAESLSNEQQAKLTTYNATVQRTIRQTELNSRMEEVNLDARLKVELSELSEKNATERANMTTDQQMRLANLNTLVDFKKADAGFAQQMELANLGNEQQMELAMLQEKSAVDAANFTEANRGRTQELNTYVQVMSQNEQLKQNADMANLSMEEKIELANLSSRSQADMASMSAENIQQLQMYEKKMQAGQVNAQLAQAMGLANLSNEQAAGMFNAQMNANLDVAAMSNEQQMELANSKFMQSMTATQFSADQQSAIQNATMLTQVDLANADARTRVSVENAKNFLSMDMSNLNNRQQGIIMDQQLEQQALLSDQAAQNAAKQFGATSQNQIDQFMISQSNSMKQFNTSARNAMESFNVTEANRMEAIEAGNFLQADQFTAQLEADINKFNASIETQRDQWNAANAQAVEQSNINWRRQANTIDTAAANAANQQNVQNAYNISALDQTQLWQQLRDEAAYIRQAYENNEQREATLIATAIGNESGSAKDATTSTSSLLQLIRNYGGI